MRRTTRAAKRLRDDRVDDEGGRAGGRPGARVAKAKAKEDQRASRLSESRDLACSKPLTDRLGPAPACTNLLSVRLLHDNATQRSPIHPNLRSCTLRRNLLCCSSLLLLFSLSDSRDITSPSVCLPLPIAATLAHLTTHSLLFCSSALSSSMQREIPAFSGGLHVTSSAAGYPSFFIRTERLRACVERKKAAIQPTGARMSSRQQQQQHRALGDSTVKASFCFG